MRLHRERSPRLIQEPDATGHDDGVQLASAVGRWVRHGPNAGCRAARETDPRVPDELLDDRAASLGYDRHRLPGSCDDPGLLGGRGRRARRSPVTRWPSPGSSMPTIATWSGWPTSSPATRRSPRTPPRRPGRSPGASWAPCGTPSACAPGSSSVAANEARQLMRSRHRRAGRRDPGPAARRSRGRPLAGHRAPRPPRRPPPAEAGGPPPARPALRRGPRRRPRSAPSWGCRPRACGATSRASVERLRKELRDG